MRNKILCLSLALACLSGCGDNASKTLAGEYGPQLEEAMKEIQARQEAHALPEAFSPEGLRVASAEVASKKDNEVQISVILRNETDRVLEGVGLMVTFMDRDGVVVGGYSTSHAFYPAVAANGHTVFELSAPAFDGEASKWERVSVEVLSREPYPSEASEAPAPAAEPPAESGQ